MDPNERKNLRKWAAARERAEVVCRVYGHIKPNPLDLGKDPNIEVDLSARGGGWALILHCSRGCGTRWPHVIDRRTGSLSGQRGPRYRKGYLRGKRQGGDGYTMSREGRDLLRLGLWKDAGIEQAVRDAKIAARNG